MKPIKKCLVSACLTGLCTRYDGLSKACPSCLRQLMDFQWIPICPEQLGGLPTPRPPARLVGGDGYGVLAGSARVVDQVGTDVTKAFVLGAAMVLDIARMQKIDICFLKSGSPSCGREPVTGVTAALLLRHHIRIVSF